MKAQSSDRSRSGAPSIPKSTYDFKAPINPSRSNPGDPLVVRLAETAAFRRLRHIRFLGGIDYRRVPAPNGRRGSRRYTRHQHSLGVARLALRYCELKGLDGSERKLAVVAAMLHDIGHAPLSHSLEPVFRAEFGIDHHRASEAIVTGAVPLGREIRAILADEGVDVERLAAVMSGREPGYDGFFSGPINFDTIEGILRSQTYERPTPRAAGPETVMEAAALRRDDADRIAVDDFWTYKDLVYRSIINAEDGVLADAACQAVMRRHLAAFSAEDFYATEEALFRKLPGLRRLLLSPSFTHDVGALLDTAVRHKIRRFMVDPAGDFFARDDGTRYRQSRIDGAVLPSDGPSTVLTRDLFDDASGD